MKKGIAGSTLKIIAIIAMTIDHIGAAVLARMLMAVGLGELDSAKTEVIMEWLTANAELYTVYTVLRTIGRIAFPIFCFLLVEGFIHTSNTKKYAIRLALFALISEIPFDLAFQSKVLEFSYQNVFFTLAIGCITMMGLKYVENWQQEKQVVRVLLLILVAAVGMGAAELLRTDYSAMGVLVIVILYLFRSNRIYQAAMGALAFVSEMAAMFGFLPILFYNGKRGLNMKYIFYVFYPLHLLILFIICYFMGLAGYSAI